MVEALCSFDSQQTIKQTERLEKKPRNTGWQINNGKVEKNTCKWNITWNEMFKENSGEEKESIVNGLHAQKTKKQTWNGWQKLKQHKATQKSANKTDQ